MPIDSTVFGMNSRWFKEALEQAPSVNLGEGCTAKAISHALFLATKFEAFGDRGKGDIYGSHDMEDIVTLVDGHAGIVDAVMTATPDVRQFIVRRIDELVRNRDFEDALPGHLSSMFGARDRAPIVMKRFTDIASI